MEKPKKLNKMDKKQTDKKWPKLHEESYQNLKRTDSVSMQTSISDLIAWWLHIQMRKTAKHKADIHKSRLLDKTLLILNQN